MQNHLSPGITQLRAEVCAMKVLELLMCLETNPEEQRKLRIDTVVVIAFNSIQIRFLDHICCVDSSDKPRVHSSSNHLLQPLAILHEDLGQRSRIIRRVHWLSFIRISANLGHHRSITNNNVVPSSQVNVSSLNQSC